MTVDGIEWIVEAHGCDAASLRDESLLRGLFDEIIRDLKLHPVAAPVWHRFPHPAGLTGMVVLAESHLACHTFPEHQSFCLNLFCCRPRSDWDFEGRLKAMVGADDVRVRRVERPYVAVKGEWVSSEWVSNK